MTKRACLVSMECASMYNVEGSIDLYDDSVEDRYCR